MADATLHAPRSTSNPFPLLALLTLAAALLLPSLAAAHPTRQHAPARASASAGVVFRAGASASVGTARTYYYYPATDRGPRYRYAPARASYAPRRAHRPHRRPVLLPQRPAYAPARASYAPRRAHRPHRRLNCRTALAGFVTVCTAGAR